MSVAIFASPAVIGARQRALSGRAEAINLRIPGADFDCMHGVEKAQAVSDGASTNTPSLKVRLAALKCRSLM
jgi:hypothetical protein